jgi:hypothetical protein
MRDPSDYAGKTVRLRPDAAELGGQQAEVVDWYERLGDGVSWRDNPGDPRAENYRLRHALGGLPDDDDVLFARVDGMGQLIHLTEIEGYIAPTPGPGGPAQPNPGAIGALCPGCHRPIKREDLVAKVAIGPGADPVARALAKAGGTGWACVFVDVHWACRTGDEQYEQAGS